MKIVAPPEDWKNALNLEGVSALELLDYLKSQLGIEVRIDKDTNKVYVDLPTPKARKPLGKTVSFPAGQVRRAFPPQSDCYKYEAARPESAAILVEGPASTKLSEHFTLGEFAPRPGVVPVKYDAVRVAPKLVEMLEEIRANINTPLRPRRRARTGGGSRLAAPARCACTRPRA